MINKIRLQFRNIYINRLKKIRTKVGENFPNGKRL